MCGHMRARWSWADKHWLCQLEVVGATTDIAFWAVLRE
jgi:hypothetical protein